MEIVDDISVLEAGEGASAVCVVARPVDRALIDAAAASLGVPDYASRAPSRTRRHPRVYVEGERVSVLAFAALDGSTPLAVELLATERGLLVIAEDPALAVVRRAARKTYGDGRVALASVLTDLARATTEALDDRADELRGVVANAWSFRSAPERAELTEIRASVFNVQQLCAAQEYLLGPDEDLVTRLPDAALRPLRQARAAFAEADATASRVHAFAGDVLSEQSALVSERLTLVATIFLPLTVGTAFFGMNFGWMTARIGSAAAFFSLGVAFPVLLTVATVMLIGRAATGGTRRER
ncbi:MAG TPA: CorA family divalent cation transporter [Thermoleophilaceae bacterium]